MYKSELERESTYNSLVCSNAIKKCFWITVTKQVKTDFADLS